MTKCFEYDRKVCVPSSKPANSVVQWDNEKLKRVGGEVKSLCAVHDTFDCKPVVQVTTATIKVSRVLYAQ